MEKKQLTKKEYIQYLGIIALAKLHFENVKQLEDKMASLLGVQKDSYGYHGELSDEFWGEKFNGGGDYLLQALGIKKPDGE